jgi:beta-glucosidase
MNLFAAAVNSSSNVIVAMHIPGVVDVAKQWIDSENVTAVIAAWYPGQEAGNSIVDVLYGDVNFSGTLPFTWAKSYDD